MNVEYSGKFEVLYCPKCKESTSQELITLNTVEAYLCTGCECVIIDDIDVLWKEAQKEYEDGELDEVTKNILLDKYKKYLEIHKDEYINNPLFHYTALCRLEALHNGRKNWMRYGQHPFIR